MRFFEDLGTYFFILFIGICVFFIILLANETGKQWKFDDAFDSGSIVIEHATLVLGETGYPADFGYQSTIPTGKDSSSIPEYPRLFSLDGGCHVFDFDGTQVYATVKAPLKELVEIQMPIKQGGAVNICIPDGMTVDIVLWGR